MATPALYPEPPLCGQCKQPIPRSIYPTGQVEKPSEWCRRKFCSRGCFALSRSNLDANDTLIPERCFWPHVEKGARHDACWNWTGDVNAGGYAYIRWRAERKSHRINAARYSYILAYGAFPDGMEPHHRCFNPRCVNPDHIEPVTHEENLRLRRRELMGKRQRPDQYERCVNGHTLNDTTRRITPSGRAACRICDREANRRYRASRREKLTEN